MKRGEKGKREKEEEKRKETRHPHSHSCLLLIARSSSLPLVQLLPMLTVVTVVVDVLTFSSSLHAGSSSFFAFFSFSPFFLRLPFQRCNSSGFSSFDSAFHFVDSLDFCSFLENFTCISSSPSSSFLWSSTFQVECSTPQTPNFVQFRFFFFFLFSFPSFH